MVASNRLSRTGLISIQCSKLMDAIPISETEKPVAPPPKPEGSIGLETSRARDRVVGWTLVTFCAIAVAWLFAGAEGVAPALREPYLFAGACLAWLEIGITIAWFLLRLPVLASLSTPSESENHRFTAENEA